MAIGKILKTALFFLLYIIDWLRRNPQPPQKSREGDSNDSVKKAMISKIRQSCFLLIILLSTGCYKTSTVYVPDGAPVRLREDAKQVKVWVKVDGEWIDGRLTIPEGWYCVYLTEEEIEIYNNDK